MESICITPTQTINPFLKYEYFEVLNFNGVRIFLFLLNNNFIYRYIYSELLIFYFLIKDPKPLPKRNLIQVQLDGEEFIPKVSIKFQIFENNNVRNTILFKKPNPTPKRKLTQVELDGLEFIPMV